MPNYIIENVDGVFKFYLPKTVPATTGGTVEIKDLKKTKTITGVNKEIADLQAMKAKKQAEAVACAGSCDEQITNLQALLALMV